MQEKTAIQRINSAAMEIYSISYSRQSFSTLRENYNFHEKRIRGKFGFPYKDLSKKEFEYYFPFMSDSYLLIKKITIARNLLLTIFSSRKPPCTWVFRRGMN